MNRLLATTAVIALGIATQAQAQSFSDAVIADLEAQGYTDIEVETDGSETIIEAILGDTLYEFIYDTATEDLLETETELLSDEDDEDDEDDEEDMDDADDADDADESDEDDEEDDDEDDEEDEDDEDEDDEDDEDEDDEEDDD